MPYALAESLLYWLECSFRSVWIVLTVQLPDGPARAPGLDPETPHWVLESVMADH